MKQLIKNCFNWKQEYLSFLGAVWTWEKSLCDFSRQLVFLGFTLCITCAILISKIAENIFTEILNVFARHMFVWKYRKCGMQRLQFIGSLSHDCMYALETVLARSLCVRAMPSSSIHMNPHVEALISW